MRGLKIYYGNASKWNDENFHDLSEKYLVSEEGKVYTVLGEELKQYCREGYLYVKLEIGNKERLTKVHRIVACTYTDICGEYNEVVNHLDENKKNNNVNNLRWCTNKENLSWGTIEERTKEKVEFNRNIKTEVKKLGINPNKEKIRIRKLKDKYKINIGKQVYYTKGFSSVIDYEKKEEIINDKEVLFIKKPSDIVSVGDIVKVVSSRPLSKTKHFVLDSIVEEAVIL